MTPGSGHQSLLRTAPRARLLPAAGAPPGILDLVPAGNTVGRGDECSLRCDDQSLSRLHCHIWFEAGHWWVRDEGSANGTLVDGQPVQRAALADGQILGFGGRVTYRVHIEEGRPAGLSWQDRLFCLRLVPRAGGASHLLNRRLTIVGRNETADVVLPHPQVSGIHARIEGTGSRLGIRDSGSRNGTTVNGRAVRRATMRPGDVVAFGDLAFDVRRTWWPTGGAWFGLGAGALVLVAALLVPLLLRGGGPEVERLWTRQMYLEQAETSLTAAVRAYDRKPRASEVAKAQFDIARRSLIAADVLRPDHQSEAEVREAVLAVARASEVSTLLAGRDVFEMLTHLEREPVRPATREPRANDDFDLAKELSLIVAEFGIDTDEQPLPPLMLEDVERLVKFWTEDKRGFTIRTRRRAEPHLDMMRRELRRHRLPEIFCYLPFLESGYRTQATSTASARGMWQFMKGTAGDFGLRVDDDVDERTDPLLATRAACRYLDYLLDTFGPNAFMCAVAAYNKGHNGMRRCLNRNSDNWRSAWKFWDLVAINDGCLKPETIEYVPRFLAAVVVMRRPEVFGLDGT